MDALKAIILIFCVAVTDGIDPCKYNYTNWTRKLSNLALSVSVPAQCIAPLGMENGSIKDEDITASSSFDHGNVGPRHARYR